MIPLGDGLVLVPRVSAAWQHAFNTVTPLDTRSRYKARRFHSSSRAFRLRATPRSRRPALISPSVVA
jgi:hypothetical protein